MVRTIALVSSSACSRLPAVRHNSFAPKSRKSSAKRQTVRTASASESGELPAELQGLCISEDGQHLIDSKTGKVVNEFGATRFDVAVRAMRGEFDPPAFVENTERSSGLLLDSLLQFPATYDFQIVVKTAGLAAAAAEGAEAAEGGSSGRSSTEGSSGGSSDEGSSSGASSSSTGASSRAGTAAAAILERYRALIADTCAADIPPEACSVKERLGGKFVSLTIPARVQAAHAVDLVLAALEGDPAVVMKY